MTRTRTKRIFALSGVAILALMTIMAFVPAANAQPLAPICENQGEATLENENKPPIPAMDPLESDSFEFSIDYTWQQGSHSLTPIPITISLSPSESWLSVTPETSVKTVSIDSEPGSGGTKTVSVQFSVLVSNDAPYKDRANIDIEVSAGGGTCIVPPQTPYEDAMSVQAGFYESWEVRFERMFIPTGQNAQEVIPMTITNSGNGPILVTPDFHERSSENLEVILPSSFRVDRATGGESVEATRNVEVNTPFKNGYENRLDSLLLILRAEPDPRDDSIEMREHQVNAVIRTQGVYVPGFEAAFMVLALLGAAMVAKKRQ